MTEHEQRFQRIKESIRVRVWQARELANGLPKSIQEDLRDIHTARAREAESLGELFVRLENRPCLSCTTSCCGTSSSPGYFHEEDYHPDILSGQVDLAGMAVPLSEEEEVEFESRSSRCTFLSPTGCNIPVRYRSLTCLTYQCTRLSKATGCGPRPSGWWAPTVPTEKLWQLGRRAKNIITQQ